MPGDRVVLRAHDPPHRPRRPGLPRRYHFRGRSAAERRDDRRRWVRRGDRKLITFDAEKKPPELYDFRNDPREQTDLAPQHTAEVEALRAMIDQWWNGRAAAGVGR